MTRKINTPFLTTWGTVGILYNTSMVAPEDVPTKWADLWDEKFKGEILMQDSVRDAFMVALKSLGYSMNSESKDELEQAKEDADQTRNLWSRLMSSIRSVIR